MGTSIRSALCGKGCGVIRVPGSVGRPVVSVKWVRGSASVPLCCDGRMVVGVLVVQIEEKGKPVGEIIDEVFLGLHCPECDRYVI